MRSILKTNDNVRLFVNRVLEYLEEMYGSTKYYHTTDEIAVWQDKHGPVVRFRRKGGKVAPLRLKK